MTVLYVSYNGLHEPIGRSQVFRYVLAQSASHRFVIVSFERSAARGDHEKHRALLSQLQAVGATWIVLPYRDEKPRFLAAATNLVRGVWSTLRAVRQYRVEVIHARSYLGALIALPSHLVFKTPYLFDMRGFWPDEGAGSGRWRAGSLTHRALKWIERILLQRAGGLVTLTESAVTHLRDHFPEAGGDRPIVTISTCADLDRFHPGAASMNSAMVLGYAGSATDAYLFDEYLSTFLAISRRVEDARMLILNRNDHDDIHRMLVERGIDARRVEIASVDPDSVPEYMRRMSVGTVFVRPYPAKIGSTPTKLAEFLGTGLPCLGNAGCGDVAEILDREAVGVSIASFSPENIDAMVDRLLEIRTDPELGARCRELAERQFSLAAACQRYDALYRALVPVN